MEHLEDYFIHDINQEDRLVNDWLTHGKIIVAFDYDNTVFDYHGKGLTFPIVKKQLNQLYHMGCKVICFSCSDVGRFKEIEDYLALQDIPHHGVNIDSDEVPFKGRKIFYNVFYDDRAGLGQVVHVMEGVISQMKYHMKEQSKKLCLRHGSHDIKAASEGTICSISGETFIVNGWNFRNGYPMVFRDAVDKFDFSGEKLILPVFEDIIKYIPKKP